MLEFTRCCAERRHEHEGVADGACQQSGIPGGEADAGSHLLLPRKRTARRGIRHQVQSRDQATLAHRCQMLRMARREVRKETRKQRNFRLQSKEGLLFLEDFQTSQSHCAGEGISSVAMAIEKGL